ncbi:MAG: response regulator [Candidatus Sulfotelmatobacter sp.]
MMVTLLESAGYKVLDTGTAESAVRIAQSAKEPLHMLLTDVLLPDLNGVELSALLRMSRPELRVLLISGYTGELIAQYKAMDPGVRLIEKPFTRRTLLTAIYEVLHDGD